MMQEPTQTNAADGCTKGLETAKYLEWRNQLSMGYDSGDDAETSKREALAESGRWARVEALHAIPRSVLIATFMQQTFPIEPGLSKLRGKLRAQLWLTVAD